MSCRPTEHYDSACQNRQIQDTNAKKNSATTAGMQKNMDAFLKKCSQKPDKDDKVEKQSEGSTASSATVPEEMSTETKDGSYDSDRDQDLDATL